MVIARRSETSRSSPDPLRQMLMPASRPASRVPQFGKLGVNWALVLQVGGWIIQGIGLGMSVYDSISSGAEKTGVQPGDLSNTDIAALATSIAAKDPAGRSAEQWQRDLTAMLGGTAPIRPTAPVCPVGFYRDPATGACLPLQKAGLFSDMSTGGWIALGVGGLLLARVLKLV